MTCFTTCCKDTCCFVKVRAYSLYLKHGPWPIYLRIMSDTHPSPPPADAAVDRSICTTSYRATLVFPRGWSIPCWYVTQSNGTSWFPTITCIHGKMFKSENGMLYHFERSDDCCLVPVEALIYYEMVQDLQLLTYPLFHCSTPIQTNW